MEIIVKVSELVESPAQMRSRHDLGKLAELTFQMYVRGWDPDRPALVRRVNGSVEIIRAHRRRMAYLMSLALREEHPWDGQGDPPVTAESIQAKWEAAIAGQGDIHAVVNHLAGRFRDTEIVAQEFQGDERQAVLALQGDNFGDEKPDALGIARSLRYGVAKGLTLNEMAVAMGQTAAGVKNIFDLANIDPEVAGRIVDGELGMTLAPLLASLPGDKQAAAARLIKSIDGRLFRIARFKEITPHFREWPGLAAPLMAKHQFARNVGRSMAALWDGVLAADPVRAWHAAVSLMYLDRFTMPWESQEALSAWLDALQVGQPSQSWALRLTLVVVSCETCPISRLPAERLDHDLTSPALPCRTGHAVTGCFHGLAEGDPFDVRVPPIWAGLPGVVQEDGYYRVKSYDDLLAAWTARRDKEVADKAAAELEAEKRAKAEARAAKKGKEQPAGKATASAPAPTAPAGPSPVEQQRQEIRFFMDTHEAMRSDHVLATPCAGCQHRLEKSPSKSDPDAPHCAWADRPRLTRFSKIVLPGGAEIPVCHQYMPARPWAEIIPDYFSPPADIQRDWLIEQIKSLVSDSYFDNGKMLRYFQFLTGRPMSGDAYGGWFDKRLGEEAGSLTDGQLYTLFVLALGERERFKSTGEFWSPGDNTMTQMVKVSSVAMKEAK